MQKTIDVMRLHPVVKDLDDDALARLAAASFEARFADGEVLVGFGDSPDVSYVIASGEVQVLLRAHYGAELIMRVIGPGLDVGALAWIDGGTQPTEYVAAGPVTAIGLPADAVRREMLRRPDLLLAVASRLSDQIRMFADSVTDLAFLDVRRRLAKLVLAASEGGQSEIRLAAHQAEAAARLGVTRQTYNKASSELVRRGWIRASGARIHIVDRSAIERYIGS